KAKLSSSILADCAYSCSRPTYTQTLNQPSHRSRVSRARSGHAPGDPMKHTVALIDDHPLFRQGLKALVSEQPDMEVVAEATDGRGAVRIAETIKPDVLVMDLALEGGDGISAGQDVARAAPSIRMLA